MRIAKFLFCIRFLILTNLSNAQESGINFTSGLSWQQIVTKAKAENKYIFLDCYTTWCLPCKKMEKEVYSLDKTGKAFNDKFICVKLQMDSTNNDADNVKKNYADARYISKNYSIAVYPTFLFFTQDGKMLYRKEGLVEADAFIGLATEVFNPKNNYYLFLENYKKGIRDTSKLAFMAIKASELNDTANASGIAREYIKSFNGIKWLNTESIDFLRRFTNRTTDKGFKLFWQYADTINKIMDDGDYSQGILHRLIYIECINPNLISQEKVDWALLYSNIEKKYGKYYAERVTAAAKLNKAHIQEKWDEYTRYLSLFVEKYTYPKIPVTESSAANWKDFFLNNCAWDIFKYSHDREELTKALSWSSRAVSIRPNSNWMDTYANILYKMGEDKLAIQWEEIASKLDSTDKSIADNLQKMKAKQPTWPRL